MANPFDLLNIKRKAVAPMETAGAPGYAVHGGVVQEIEKDSNLNAYNRWKAYSEMLLNTAIVGAGVRYFLNLIGKVTWKVNPADHEKRPISESEAQKMADLVEEILHDMDTPFARCTRRSAMYRFWGFSIQEWTAKIREDGVIGFKDVAPRPQFSIEKWDVDLAGEVLGVVQTSPQTMQEIYLPRQKIVYLVDDSLSDSPQGAGLFRHIYASAKRMEIYKKLEAVGFETDLRGIPVLRAPIAALKELRRAGKMTESDYNSALTALRTFIQNHIKGKETGLLLDSSVYTTLEDNRPSSVYKWTAELLKGGQTSLPDLNVAIGRELLEIARVLGIEHLLLGSDSKGSHALAKTKTQSFFLIVDSTLSEIKDSYETDIIERLFDLNGWNKDLMPTLTPESVQFRDIEQMAAVLADLATAGLAPDDPAENEMRDLIGLSHKPEMSEEELALQHEQQRQALAGGGSAPVDPEEPMPNEEEEGT